VRRVGSHGPDARIDRVRARSGHFRQQFVQVILVAGVGRHVGQRRISVRQQPANDGGRKRQADGGEAGMHDGLPGEHVLTLLRDEIFSKDIVNIDRRSAVCC